MKMGEPTHPGAPAFGSEFSSGMRLREYVATHVLAGILASPADSYQAGTDLVGMAVDITDRLLAELAQPKGGA